MTNDCNAQQHVSRVAAKLPSLGKQNIKLWFLLAEANFELYGITNDVTKYNNVIAAIDSEILSVVSDLLFDPPHADRYTTLKNRLIQEFSDSENQQIRKLLSELQLGDDKPSHLLRKMKELAGTALNDDFFRNLWFQRLPSEIQTILSVSSEKLENLAKLADKIAEVRPSP
ncbi:transposon Ty3-G Gag-Pol polyprotein [Nephila pilipes]|uniref:Transposon Ty3-G Gag-Pol polyprotein n=1 Tax=Nephila pilipes TaxID=299642 RepID=A0A8X6QKE3_NEPPI|nr:transposon Ty3-G Gag-Pol polyprotein [Nephila pilipes]